MQGEGGAGSEQSLPEEYRYAEHEQPEQCVPEQPQETEQQGRRDATEGGDRPSAAAGSPADQARESYNARAAGFATTGETVAMIAAVSGGVAEGAGHIAEAFGVAGLGAALELGAEVYHVFSTIGEAHEANARESTYLGARHAVEVAGTNAQQGNGSHLESGKPYTSEEMRECTRDALTAAHASGETVPLMVENTKGFGQQYAAGEAAVVKGLNDALAKGTTPAERRAALTAFVGAAGAGLGAHQAERTAQERARLGLSPAR